MSQTDLTRDLDRIARWAATHAPQDGPMFRPGAATAAITEVESKLGISFPDEWRAFYTHADGQPEDAPAISDAFSLAPLSEVVSAADFLNDFFPDGKNEEDPDHAPIDADAGVRASWWSKGWIPVLSNGAGDYYCVDMDPAPGGAAGQIVSYFHDETWRSIVAPSLGKLLATIADGLDAGTYGLEDGMITELQR